MDKQLFRKYPTQGDLLNQGYAIRSVLNGTALPSSEQIEEAGADCAFRLKTGEIALVSRKPGKPETKRRRPRP